MISPLGSFVAPSSTILLIRAILRTPMRQQTMSQRTFRKRTGELVDEPDRRRRGPTRPKGLSIRDSTGAPTARRTEWPRATVDSLRRYGEENDYSKLVRLLDQIGDGALHLGKPRPRLHRPSQGSGHGLPDTPSGSGRLRLAANVAAQRSAGGAFFRRRRLRSLPAPKRSGLSELPAITRGVIVLP